MTSAGEGTWSFATAREPIQFAAGVDARTPDVEHAVGSENTLCGIAMDKVTVYRHLFHPSQTSACPVCRDRYAEAPTQPSGQERLHDLVLTNIDVWSLTPNGLVIYDFPAGESPDCSPSHGFVLRMIASIPVVVRPTLWFERC